MKRLLVRLAFEFSATYSQQLIMFLSDESAPAPADSSVHCEFNWLIVNMFHNEQVGRN